ncbi:MAG: hypothetical protein M3Y59_12500 [Myxococcota bacterium]|nr:hypothetical protein [Myxococcota bacterium]
MADQPTYEIEFYEDKDGNEPALAFMRALNPLKKRAIGVAISEVLQYEGPNVANGNMGRNLKGGLYEFKLDQNAEQILRRRGKGAKCPATASLSPASEQSTVDASPEVAPLEATPVLASAAATAELLTTVNSPASARMLDEVERLRR